MLAHVLDPGDTVKVGTGNAYTVIVIVLDVAGLPVVQVALEVIIHFTASPVRGT